MTWVLVVPPSVTALTGSPSAPVLLPWRFRSGSRRGLFGVDITRSWTNEEVEDIGVEVTDRTGLRRTMGDALGSVGLTEERREEVLNALAIGEIPVSDVIVDREDSVALSTTEDLTTNLERVRREPRGRFPPRGRRP